VLDLGTGARGIVGALRGDRRARPLSAAGDGAGYGVQSGDHRHADDDRGDPAAAEDAPPGSAGAGRFGGGDLGGLGGLGAWGLAGHG
jgi:hypothetical protein